MVATTVLLGVLIDEFGIEWIFNCELKKS